MLIVQNQDASEFVTFAQAGSFTTGITDLSGITDSIYTVLGTFLASVTATETTYIITRTAGQSIAQAQSAGGLQWDAECGSGYDSVGICGPWYYDGPYFLNALFHNTILTSPGTDTYSLVSQQKWQTDESDLMKTLFEGDSPIASASLFFTGSLQCSQVPGNGNGGGKPALSSDYTSFTCIANNKVCTWAWDDSDLASNGYFLPGCSESDLPSVFDFNCCTGTYDQCGKCAPFAYFGPAIEDSEGTKLCHDNCGGGEVG